MRFNGGETHDYLFIHCNVGLEVMDRFVQVVWSCLGVACAVESFFSMYLNENGLRKVAKPSWQGALFAGLWCIWLAPNLSF